MDHEKRVGRQRSRGLRRTLLAALAGMALIGTTGCSPQAMQQAAPLLMQALPMIQGLLSGGNTQTAGLPPPPTSFQPQSPPTPGVAGQTNGSTCQDSACAQGALAGNRDQVQIDLRDGVPTTRDPVARGQDPQAVARAEAALRQAQAYLAEVRQQRPFSGSRVAEAEAAVRRAEADLATAKGQTPPS